MQHAGRMAKRCCQRALAEAWVRRMKLIGYELGVWLRAQEKVVGGENHEVKTLEVVGSGRVVVGGVE